MSPAMLDGRGLTVIILVAAGRAWRLGWGRMGRSAIWSSKTV